MKSMHKALIVYVSSPHAGYLNLFRKHADAVLYVFGDELIQEFGPLRRNVPGVRPKEAVQMISALGIFSEVRELSLASMGEVRQCSSIVMPDEDVSDVLAEKYFAGAPVTFDGSWRLRVKRI
jgi:hypothetical protein